MSLLNNDINKLDARNFEVTQEFLEIAGWVDVYHPIYLMYQKQFIKNCFKVKIDIIKNPGVMGGGWEATVMFKDLLSTTDKKYKMGWMHIIRTIKDYERMMDLNTVLDRMARKRDKSLEK